MTRLLFLLISLLIVNSSSARADCLVGVDDPSGKRDQAGIPNASKSTNVGPRPEGPSAFREARVDRPKRK